MLNCLILKMNRSLTFLVPPSAACLFIPPLHSSLLRIHPSSFLLLPFVIFPPFLIPLSFITSFVFPTFLLHHRAFASFPFFPAFPSLPSFIPPPPDPFTKLFIPPPHPTRAPLPLPSYYVMCLISLSLSPPLFSPTAPGIIHSTRLFDLPSICPFPLFPPPPFMPILLEFYIPQLPRNGPCTTYHADFGRFPDQVIRGLALITHGAICSVFVVPVCNICLLKY